jgi:hypothetical protein
MTSAEMEDIAERAASKALENLFLAFGVDLKDPKSIIAFHDDMRHLRAWREANETIKKHALRTAVGVIVTGFFGWISLLIWKGQ